MTETTTQEVADKVTGYQYGDDMSFIGTYAFVANLDDRPLHLPPRTTLIAPPSNLPAGQEPAFDIATGNWGVRAEDLSWMDADSREKYLAAHAGGV